MFGYEAALRLKLNGPNTIVKSKERPIWLKFLMSFLSGFSPLLWFAAFFVFLSWEPFGTPPTNIYSLALAIVLLFVIFLSGLFNFYQEVVAARVMSSIDNMIPTKCIVQRDGNALEVNVQNVVVGDICSLQAGMKIPADVRIFQVSSLRVDTSMLTGEQEPMKLTVEPADKATSMLQSTNTGFMGCNIVEGEGRGVVVATGKDTQLSKIAAQVNNSAPITGLQRDLNRFVMMISVMSVFFVTVISIVWGAYLNVYHSSFMNLSSFIANAISVLVALVPEGLPLAMSMGLSIIANRLCKEHKVIVKQLSIVETMGSMSLLATDKTGTLTQNKMTVTKLLTFNRSVHLDDIVEAESAVGSMLLLFMELGSLFCNQAKVEDERLSDTPRHSFGSADEAVSIMVGSPAIHPTNTKKGPSVIGGNGVDVALMKWVLSFPDLSLLLKVNFVVKAVVPFSSATKISAVVISKSTNRATQSSAFLADLTDEDKFFAHVILKGAPEYVLDRCTKFIDRGGSESVLIPTVIDSIRANIDAAASTGGRVIAMAKLSLDRKKYNHEYVFKTDGEPNFPLTGMTFICCVAVSDPPREGVKEAVGDLRRAGVKIAMVTGDAPNTAVAIARQVGLVTLPEVLDGSTLTQGNVADLESHPSVIRGLVDAARRNNPIESEGNEPTKALLILGHSLDSMGPAEWDRICTYREIVFSRVTPDQKLLIVSEFQKRGERVGVTGDGVNDSPALKKADVGIAMNSGSEVAKDAAHVILLEDNFAAIVKGVEEGRLIFANLRKVIAYQIAAGCWSELLPVLATFFIGMPQPLSSFLMIIVSCMTDVYAGIALTRETSEVSLMTLPPRDLKKEPLVRWTLIGYSYFFYGNLESVAIFAAFFMYMSARGPHTVANPVAADDDGKGVFPAGYPPQELIFAWNWGTDAATDDSRAETGNLGADNSQASITGSSVFFIVLIICQWGHLCSIRRSSPYFSDSIMDTQKKGGTLLGRLCEELGQSCPKRSIVLVSLLFFYRKSLGVIKEFFSFSQAILLSALTGVFFTEVPLVQVTCGTDSVPPFYWGLGIAFSVAIFLVAEVFKWVILLFNLKF